MRRSPSESGGALVEAAIALPLLIVIALATADFGRVFYTAMAVTHAVRAGAQYGAQNNQKWKDDSGMQTAATDAASDITGFTPTASHACGCYNASTGAFIEAPVGGCVGTCVSGSLWLTVTVNGTATFRTITTYPGIPRTVTIARAARLRVQ